MLARIGREKIEHLQPIGGLEENRQQKLHQPNGCLAGAAGARGDRECRERVERFPLGQQRFVGGHPSEVYGARNRDAGFIDGDFQEGVARQRRFQRDQSAVAVAKDEFAFGGDPHRGDVLAFLHHAVGDALGAAKPAPTTLDRVDRVRLTEGVGERREILCRREHARDDDHGRSSAGREIADRRPVRRRDRSHMTGRRGIPMDFAHVGFARTP